MFSKANKTERIDADQREQYDYARKRIKKKKSLMWHFIVFLIGSVFLVVLNGVLKVGENFFIKDWFIWAILIWLFLFLIHLFNVFVMDKFMGKEWEDQQLEKLKARQQTRIDELKKQAIQEVTEKEVKIAKETRALDTTKVESIELKKKEDPNLLPPEEA
jgi:amino acid permease